VAAPVLKHPSPENRLEPAWCNRAEAFMYRTCSWQLPGYELELVHHPDPLACCLIPARLSDTRRHHPVRPG
jgi:hypothetical protein